eukprot:CAMPEP_0202399118 /NCGR_PEP_ID=MMETSP1128-20130828/1792_1 /ASSEMBLY_ACC=CAM_ASM_000463 /TAXON_ID=3047 /ORGANISM="Dunaliella tertiolecta, Strain CCMP1320" /LENGTH=292 /DNA_ID=CAMNT_0049002389 /DNA_START=22 /DNA_END=900 /DNA_ORIENTATION=+
MTSQLRVLLHALQMEPSHVESVSTSEAGSKSWRAVVAWLENTKVRGMKPEERQGLIDLDSPSWDAALSKYLATLECPIPFRGDNWTEILLWLSRHAVHLEYTDKADVLTPASTGDAKPGAPATANGSVPATQGKGPSRAPSKIKQPPYSDWSSPEVEARLREVMTALNMDTSTDLPLADMLQAVHVVLRDQVLPYLSLQAKRQHLGQGGGPQPKQQGSKPDASSSTALNTLRELPLGFATGVPALDDACRVLRLLHVRDLRSLQSSIDDAIVSVQEYVSNPRTDSSLGKIGV